MIIAVLHLSDIHGATNVPRNAASSVAAVLRALPERPGCIVLLVTGDLAYTGAISEYEEVRRLIMDIAKEISSVLDIEPMIVGIPGNHDCDLSENGDVRRLIIEDILSKYPSDEPGGYRAVLMNSQRNYMKMARELNMLTCSSDEVVTRHVVNIDNNCSVAFDLINAAWMSQLKEVQGNIVIPQRWLNAECDNGMLVFTAMHHPYNWLKSENARLVRAYCDRCSNVVFTGHEHEAYTYSKNTTATATGYVEGGVFSDRTDGSNSDFNLVIVDTESGTYSVLNYSWSSGVYAAIKSGEGTALLRRGFGNTDSRLTPRMREYLEDPGVLLTNKSIGVRLCDIYVPPSLLRYEQIDGRVAIHHDIVPSDGIYEKIRNEKRVYITGEGSSGKTALAKYLFSRFADDAVTALIIEGKHLHKASREHLQKILQRTYEDQYEHPSVEAYLQSEHENKALIIDDYASVSMRRTERSKILTWLSDRCGYLIVLGGDYSYMEEMVLEVSKTDDGPPMKYYRIMEMGHVLRRRMTEKWYNLKGTEWTDEAEIEKKILETEGVINTILGKNLVPSHPIYILSILQVLEAHEFHDTVNATYGYFYDVFITSALHRESRASEDIDASYTFLSELAWYMKTRGERLLSADEYESFSREHAEAYSLDLDAVAIRNCVDKSGILEGRDGGVAFRYKYLYYYFIARYMRDNQSEPAVERALDECIQDLHRDECTNILIFLTYMSKNPEIVNRLLAAGSEVFSETVPCNLATHVEFISRLADKIPSVVYHDTDIEKVREERLQSMDEEDEKARVNQESDDDTDSGHSELYELNRAYKTMQIIGQILRNYTGSLRKHRKIELASNCMGIGMRTLGVLYGTIEEHLEDIIHTFSQMLGQSIESEPMESREEIAKQLLFKLSIIICYDVVRRVAVTLGSRRLISTISAANGEEDNMTIEFVELVIRMNTLKDFPLAEMERLRRKVQNNLFASTLLKILVVDYMYMYPMKEAAKQRICSLLQIQLNRPLHIIQRQRN